MNTQTLADVPDLLVNQMFRVGHSALAPHDPGRSAADPSLADVPRITPPNWLAYPPLAFCGVNVYLSTVIPPGSGICRGAAPARQRRYRARCTADALRQRYALPPGAYGLRRRSVQGRTFCRWRKPPRAPFSACPATLREFPRKPTIPRKWLLQPLINGQLAGGSDVAARNVHKRVCSKIPAAGSPAPAIITRRRRIRCWQSILHTR
jgi:hypothetical protein